MLLHPCTSRSSTCLMVMVQPWTSLQKYPKSPFHTYEVKGLYQWYLLMTHICRVILTKHVFLTIELLQNLGFTIHLIKSILTPTQRITSLGFIIDSVQMTLDITEEKKDKIHNLCLESLRK